MCSRVRPAAGLGNRTRCWTTSDSRAPIDGTPKRQHWRSQRLPPTIRHGVLSKWLSCEAAWKTDRHYAFRVTPPASVSGWTTAMMKTRQERREELKRLAARPNGIDKLYSILSGSFIPFEKLPIPTLMIAAILDHEYSESR